jgi:hypothetical protein
MSEEVAKRQSGLGRRQPSGRGIVARHEERQ